MQMKVRPFVRIVHPPGRVLATEVSGRLEHQAFIFKAFGEDYVLPTAAVSTDGQGPFALVEVHEQEVKPCWWLRVQPEFDDTSKERPGCEVSLTYNPDVAALHVALAGRGRNPDDYNVLGPPRAGLSIGFSPDGIVNGDASVGGGSTSEMPQA